MTRAPDLMRSALISLTKRSSSMSAGEKDSFASLLPRCVPALPALSFPPSLPAVASEASLPRFLPGSAFSSLPSVGSSGPPISTISWLLASFALSSRMSSLNDVIARVPVTSGSCTGSSMPPPRAVTSQKAMAFSGTVNSKVLTTASLRHGRKVTSTVSLSPGL